MKKRKLEMAEIIKDNELAISKNMEQKDYVMAYLLVHSLIEAILRFFLHIPPNKTISFSKLIHKYENYLNNEQYPIPTFVKELKELNQRRNRIVHQMWQKGFTWTNQQAEDASQIAIVMYSLLIEWLDTFDFNNTNLDEYNSDGIDHD